MQPSSEQVRPGGWQQFWLDAAGRRWMTCPGTAAECAAAPCETNRAAIRAAHAREREARQNASRKGKIPTLQRRRGKVGRRGPLLLKAAALRSLRRMENATRSRVALRGRSELQELAGSPDVPREKERKGVRLFFRYKSNGNTYTAPGPTHRPRRSEL